MPGDDRSQKATQTRRQDARKRGQVERRRDLTGALGVLSVVLLLGWQAGLGVESWRSLFSQMLDRNGSTDLKMMGGIVSAMGAALLGALAIPFALV